MSWSTGQSIQIHCPRCGSEVSVPVEIDRVDVVSYNTVRIWFVNQINVQGHICADNVPPIDRFIKTGELDDPHLK